MASRHTIEVQGLECCICIELMVQPKLLACSHTFCQKCLEDLANSHEKSELTCPLCRVTTPLEGNDVSKLQTNIAIKSMVAEVKSGIKICTICSIEGNATSPALSYCEKCSHFLCESCLADHGKFKLTTNHVLVNVDDVISGKVKIKRNCGKHPQEEKEWVCVSCREPVCFRCRVIDHGGSDHEIEDVTKYMTTLQDKIESFRSMVSAARETVESGERESEEELNRIELAVDKTMAEIEQACDERTKQVINKKDDLIKECIRYRDNIRGALRTIHQKQALKLGCIGSTNDLIGNGLKALLEGKALSVHDNLCSRLQEMLLGVNAEESTKRAREVVRQAGCLSFTQYNLDAEHTLGELRISQWDEVERRAWRGTGGSVPWSHWCLEKKGQLSLSGMEPQSIAATADGGMAVGYKWGGGGIELFSVDGSQGRELRGVEIRRVSVLQDGRHVIRSTGGKMSIYSQTWELIDTDVFEEVGTSGGVDVDRFDHIFVGCEYAKTVKVFTQGGGAACREVLCPGFEPRRVCTMNRSEMLVLSDDSSVRVVEEDGTVRYDVNNEGFGARVAVTWDDYILIGWEKDRRVSVDLYTNQLALVRRVVHDFPVDGGLRAIREFSTGEIAVCDSFKLHIFHKAAVPLTDDLVKY